MRRVRRGDQLWRALRGVSGAAAAAGEPRCFADGDRGDAADGRLDALETAAYQPGPVVRWTRHRCHLFSGSIDHETNCDGGIEMKRRIGCWLVAALACPSVISAQGSAAATSVTLFNSGRVLVRRTLPLSLPGGASTQTLALGEFNPVTFTVLDPGVQLVSVKTDQTLSEETL